MASVWAALALRDVRASSAPCVVSDTHTAAEPFRSSAEICKHPQNAAHELRRKLRLHLPETIRCAFPAPSQHDMCKQAGRYLGVAPDTVERLYSGYTDKHDLALICLIARKFNETTGKTSPVAQLIIAIVGGAA